MGTKLRRNFLSTVQYSGESNHKHQHQPLSKGSHWASSGGMLGPKRTQDRELHREAALTGVTGSGASDRPVARLCDKKLHLSVPLQRILTGCLLVLAQKQSYVMYLLPKNRSHLRRACHSTSKETHTEQEGESRLPANHSVSSN